jgi:hypothetical protein
MRLPFLAVLTLAAAVLSGDGAAAQAPPVRTLQLAFHPDGLVSLSAQNVSVREILAEWARQCGCYVVNWDKLAGGPLTVPLQFERAPQGKVLESLLRQAAGFVLTPRRAGSQAISNYETIYILATSTASAGTYVPPVTVPPAVMPMPTPGSPEDEIPGVGLQPGMRPDPPAPPQQAPPPGPGVPGMAPGTAAPRPVGTPGVFVPIVPVGTPQSTAPAGQTPGTATSAPPMPVPIMPAPPQTR